ncbi:MAG: tryptophan 7-halogenase [Verrucomicrobia bacterium]|nr:tryptophan 7-halogenase [Verrucomicrobiota bacterium]MBV9643052.1 tryptophan 7-halogenase [Verrucomicrobiota bacterium]
MNEAFDVAIMGGGPAGSAAGTLLAKAGRRVAIFEKERFPRFSVGESTLPATLNTLERMGVREKIDRGGFLVKHGGEIVSACGQRVRFYFRNGFKAKRSTAYQVLRSEFDKILLDHAAESGCDVRQKTPVESFGIDADGVTLRSGNGGQLVRAQYVIDCSGRNCLIGNRYQLKRRFPDLCKFSLYAYYDDVRREDGPNGTLTRMVRTKDSWFWMIPLQGKTTSIGVVMDAEKFKSMKMSPERALTHCISEQPAVNEWMEKARRVTDVFATGDFSYRNTQLSGNRWLLAGDAAGFIDPVFSSGVYVALLSGEQAADALNIALDRPQQRAKAFRHYERRIGRVLDIYLRWASAWYTQEFVEVFLYPKEIFEIVPTVSAVLSGNEVRDFGMRWRLCIFHTLVALQKRTSKIAPKLTLMPKGT